MLLIDTPFLSLQSLSFFPPVLLSIPYTVPGAENNRLNKMQALASPLDGGVPQDRPADLVCTVIDTCSGQSTSEECLWMLCKERRIDFDSGLSKKVREKLSRVSKNEEEFALPKGGGSILTKGPGTGGFAMRPVQTVWSGWLLARGGKHIGASFEF